MLKLIANFIGYNKETQKFDWRVSITNGNVLTHVDYHMGKAHATFKKDITSFGLPDSISFAGFNTLKAKDSILDRCYFGTLGKKYERLVNYFLEDVNRLNTFINPTPPTLETVLDSMLLSYEALEQDFEDWAICFGYDEDSRSAYKVYEACQTEGRQLIKLIGLSGIEKLRNAKDELGDDITLELLKSIELV